MVSRHDTPFSLRWNVSLQDPRAHRRFWSNDKPFHFRRRYAPHVSHQNTTALYIILFSHAVTTTEEIITTPTEPPTIAYLSAADIRLAGGSVANEGRLEVRVDGRWGTVCVIGGYFLQGANTACRQLQGGIGQAALYSEVTRVMYVAMTNY